jgi:hypothetical protein
MTEKLTGLSISVSMERFTASIEHLSEHGDIYRRDNTGTVSGATNHVSLLYRKT